MSHEKPPVAISRRYLRLDARRTEVHAKWQKRLGSANAAWEKFIGNNQIGIQGHEQRQ